MSTELCSMVVVSLCATIPLAWRRHLWIGPVLVFVLGAAFGTTGIGLLGATGSLVLLALSGRVAKRVMILSLAFASTALVISSILVRSGMGRWLGIAEAIEMARQTDWAGVGWGRWAFHQAEAQRAVFALFPFESWREIAPYFGVAPSLPFHLLAEIGWAGPLFWLAVLMLSLLGALRLTSAWMRAACGSLFVFWMTSIGTTPVQFFLTVDPENVLACDRAIEKFRTTESRDLSPLSVCPEIRTLEWTAAAEGTRETFLRWHETFPRDVMPPFVLARIAARNGREKEALDWLRAAAEGRPGNDPNAALLRDEARRILDGGSERLKLWTAIPSGRPAGE